MKALSRLAFLVLLLVSTSAAAQTVVRGPYIQRTTPDSTTIVWRTDVATDGAVSFGTAAQNLTQTASSAATGTQHEVTVTGLSPNTRYFYGVGTPQAMLAGGDANHYFDTAPQVGAAVPTRMWVVGDSGTGGRDQGEVRDAMLTEVGAARPSLFLHVGDMAYSDGRDDEFQDNFFDMYQEVLRNTVTWPAMGNHEGRTSDSDTQSGPYYDAYVLPIDGAAGGLASGTEAYYSFDWGNVHLIVLDSHDSPREATGPMAAWLQQDLAATNADWIIAYWHHPPYTKGSHDSDNEGQLIDMREEILPILEAGGVDLVLGGHSHIYERSYLINGAYDTPTTAAGFIMDNGDGRPNGSGPYMKPAGSSEGAVYIVAGHGGTGVRGEGDHPVMFFSEVENGSCIIDVDGSLLNVRNVRIDGAISDEVSIARGDGVFLVSPASDELIQAASTYGIRWIDTASSTVDIEFSADDGATWSPVANGVTGGTFAWTVPAAATNLGRIRVTDTADATRTAMNMRPFTISDQTPQVVIPFGGTWKYDDDGGDYPDDAWTTLGYDDTTWKSGAAELGYGDGDETTEIYDADPNIPSVLFRHTLTLERKVDAATIEAVYDDALAVWVNGELVYDVNMPNIIETTLFSINSSADNSQARHELGADNPFVAGENVVAVMVKQANGTSSDLSMDFQLTVTLAADFPTPADMGGTGGGDSGPAPSDMGSEPGGGGDTGRVDNPIVSGDSGADAGGPSQNSGRGGCGCSSGGVTPTAWLVGAVLLGMARVRRRLRAS